MEVDIIRDIAQSVLREIEALRQRKQHLIIAIDGRCTAGKTTLAAHLQEACECNVIHMDHFFLRPEQRTVKRLNELGGNVDYERFLNEVLIPLKQGEVFSYRPYDCQTQEMAEAIRIEPHSINIIEGSYCCHPTLFEYYDLKIFMTVDETEQLQRIKHRNGEQQAVQFQNKWIQLEERYFSAYHIKERCNLCFYTEETYLGGG